MSDQSFEAQLKQSHLNAETASYVEALYENYLRDPKTVSPEWQVYFDKLPKVNGNPTDTPHSDWVTYFTNHKTQVLSQVDHAVSDVERKQSKVTQLVNAYRGLGFRQAKFDPLHLVQNEKVPELQLGFYDLSSADLNLTFYAADFNGLNRASLSEIITAIDKTYCQTIGYEYAYISDREQARFIQQRIENVDVSASFSVDEKKRILKQLIAAEGLEKYIGRKFVGQKRFSLEGGDSFLPLMDYLTHLGAKQKIEEIVIGMAHRGRLNVLINLLGKSANDLFREFEGHFEPKGKEYTGDVKYHQGFSTDFKTASGNIHVSLAFNPSHLEIIDPVVEGSVRARQDRLNDTHRNKVMPIVVHGDAAFAGQGIVMETFNLSQTRGYATGGTIHIVINNQIGFTTSTVSDARSTQHCTDIAKMVQAPIFHVNGDDPEAVLFAGRLAFEYRNAFHRDVVIDLVCYRRHGHNEADEPSGTQPLMYRAIKSQASPLSLYSEKLIRENVVKADEFQQWQDDYRLRLDEGKPIVESISTAPYVNAVDWAKYKNENAPTEVKTGVPLATLKTLGKNLEKLPAHFVLQAQVKKVMEDRQKMAEGELPINWGYAETLAYASLVTEGYLVRLTGQDCRRGTFSHRHATLHDMETGDEYTPLQHVSDQQASFTVIDSTLSEAAVMGFEYGYATAEPKSLVLWEAQFGDFANGAQVVIDQFISSGEQKWDRLCGLTLLLPHGSEGQGPEHSSARLERYLQLCAQQNMQVVVPSTPAQIFHLLRRQTIRTIRKPLIVMTPKSLLRHRLAVSSLKELSDGKFQLIIPEIDDIKPGLTRRVVLCSGKIYYELLEARREKAIKDIAIVRIEQLYPFPEAELKAELAKYMKAQEIVWCQEEPQNQGAWYCIQHHLRAALTAQQTLTYVGRDPAAAPSEGSHALYEKNQTNIVNKSLS